MYFFMLSNKKTTRVGALLLTITVVLAGCAWFLFGVDLGESGIVKAAETAIAILEAKTRDLVEAKAGLLNHADAITSIQRSFVSEDHFVDFVRLTEALGRTAGVTLQVSNAELPEKGGTVHVSIEVAGTYEQIVHFVTLLDHMPYPNIIAHISASPASANQGDRIRASLGLDLFNYRAQ